VTIGNDVGKSNNDNENSKNNNGGRKKNINDGCKNNAGGLKNEVDKNNPGKQGAQFYW
jgi:hypothetical protein